MVMEQSLRARLKPSPSGALVVLGLIIFGLLILGGLYISPRATPPQPPAGAQRGVPARKLRFVSYDLARQHPRNDPFFAAIPKLEPDYVLLQGVNEDDAVEIAELLEMQHSF